MAKRELDRSVQPSLLDRLTDLSPADKTTEPRLRYSDSLVAFRDGLQRDLEWLLNTRRTPDPAPEEFEELRSSLYHYGVPDVTSMSSDAPDTREELLKNFEEAIATFEPRLTGVNLSIVEAEGEAHRRELRFVLEGTMRLDPTPESVSFDTVLHFSTGEVDVTGKSNA